MTDLDQIVRLASELEPKRLPHFLGVIEEARQVARLRLSAPAPMPISEEWLTVSEASARLHCSRVYLYKNAHSLPFARHLGKKLLFSARGLESYLAQSK